MYNTRIKNRYLATIQDAIKKRIGKSLFEQSALIEKGLQKDLALFSIEEIQTVIHQRSYKTYAAFVSCKNMISSYIQWCHETQTINVEPVDLSVIKMPDNSIQNDSMIIRDENDLIHSIETVFGEENWHLEIPCLLLSWIGLTIDEIVNLRQSRVDLENRCIVRVDKSIAANDWSDIIHGKLMEYVLCQNGIQKKGAVTAVLSRDNATNRFIVGFYTQNSKKFGTPISNSAIQSGITRMNRAYKEKGNPPRLTIKNVWNCGRHYALYLAKKNGLQIYSKQNQEQVAKILRTESLATAHVMLGSSVPKYFRVFESAEN